MPGILDKERRRELDLSNPFEVEERWRELPSLDDRLVDRLAQRLTGERAAAEP